MPGLTRAPESPRWVLMATRAGAIVPVRQEYEAEKKRLLGWYTVARESDILPFNTPRLVEEDGA